MRHAAVATFDPNALAPTASHSRDHAGSRSADEPTPVQVSPNSRSSTRHQAPTADVRGDVRGADPLQLAWNATPLNRRLRVIAGVRHVVADRSSELTAAISPALARTAADTLASEILPLLAACRFLEREAASILRPRRLGRSGRPFWLSGVVSEIERVPFGRVLLIAPGNYPLLLAGVQALQALAAGNAVIWKPGRGGEAVARVFAAMLADAGLPAGLLTVTDESAAAAERAIAGGVDKIFLTGSAATGCAVLAQAATMLTPCVVELSGCDSVVVLPDADLTRVVKALSFGMRLNGSATCMAPRRVLLVGTGDERVDATRRHLFTTELEATLRELAPITLASGTAARLHALVTDATRHGAVLAGPGALTLRSLEAHFPAAPLTVQPVVLLHGSTALEAARTDIFAPLLTLIDVAGDESVLATEAASPFALTCSIFGSARRARILAAQLRCGTVLVNDLIVPTADPRVPFGGRRGSGFGVSRGAEGLLEMTAIRVVSTRRGRGTRHYEPTTTPHENLFRALARSAYGRTWRSRFGGVRDVIRAVRGLKEKI